MPKSPTRYTLQMRVTEQEANEIYQKASYYGLVVSEYMRLVSIHGNIPENCIVPSYEYGLNRNITPQCKVTKQQFSIVQKKAKQLGLSISQYMRFVCLNADITVDIKPPPKC